ncbi:MAG: NAD-dependent DNA ligase LigA [Bdellovibrionaceae bacterium]|nr:NAD-dependent DNA ligase LigA [Pseudobdellovibrionaceae bacterium]
MPSATDQKKLATKILAKIHTSSSRISQEEYADLADWVHELDYHYHTLDNPLVSDKEYDDFFHGLKQIESENPSWILSNSPTHRVGGAVLPVFTKGTHRLPMLSLANSYDPEDLIDFDQRIQNFLKTTSKFEYFCEPKFDGLSMEIIYENGVFTKALTRGDGVTGEDVTINVKTIKSIPLRLNSKKPPALLEVRGEVLILKEDFKSLNQFQEKEGLPTFANPRNAAAGSIRQLDSKISASRPLKFYGYNLGQYQGIEFSSQSDVYETFKELGIPTYSQATRVCSDIQEVVKFYKDLEETKSKLPFDIDGLVVKINSRALQDELGLVAKSPRWATAAKFKPDTAETVVEEIFCQVGRTGAITPVALMTPVKVGGVTVTYATLHNQEEIDRKDIRVGDTVVIQRAGDVIPEIIRSMPEKRSASSTPYRLPVHCPACKSLLHQHPDEAVVRCLNSECPAILKESLKHFASRRAMNIEKMGDRWIETFVDSGLVKSFADFYGLKKADLLNLDRQGDKSADNILKSIEHSKKTTLARFIYALGIRYIGETTAKHLADHFLTIERFVGATEDELMKVPEIGEKVAQSTLGWLGNPSHRNQVKDLISAGIMVAQAKVNTSGPLSGKSFLITGTLPIPRDQAQAQIQESGGKLLSGVSSKLNFLVAGEDPGSKLEKANNLGVTVVGWSDVLKMIENP